MKAKEIVEQLMADFPSDAELSLLEILGSLERMGVVGAKEHAAAERLALQAHEGGGNREERRRSKAAMRKLDRKAGFR